LIVCDENGGVALAGVFGGLDSGVTESTRNIFLESAYFNPVSVRKTARRHGLNTDASFHFERGADPNITIYALKRAALLIKEIANGQISSDIIDNYPSPIQPFDVDILYSHVDRLIGKKIDRERIKSILQSLEIEIVSETEHGLGLKVPPYRVDVQREADIIEEILRIHGYNSVEISERLFSSLSHGEKPPKHKLQNLISDFLCARDFTEIMSNSLTPSVYYEGQKMFPVDNLVAMINPLSNDLNVLRQTLLFGGLEAIVRNTNRQKQDLKLYEFGNIYQVNDKKGSANQLDKYHEEKHLALFMTGNVKPVNWMEKEKPANFFWLKSEVEAILNRFKITGEKFKTREVNNDIFAEGLEITIDEKLLVTYGKVEKKLLQKFDIDKEVYFAGMNWDNLLEQLKAHAIKFKELPKFPEVRRDLSLLLDKEVKYNEIEKIARESERKFLKDITLFDVYTGDRIEEGKKSYAIAFTLQDENKTLTDKQIDKIMQKISTNLTKSLNAQVRQ
jgi:phenylalanyl-tRNA synthetase beta chain